MNKPFNTPFENSLRMLLLLNVFDTPASLEKIYSIDFIIQYGYIFGYAKENLNGNNPYMFSEYASKREVAQEAIRSLVLKGLVQALPYSEGFLYVITPEGEDFCSILESEYSKEYVNIAKIVNDATLNFSDRALMSKIYHASERAL